jgi:hypothetical protein
MRWRGETGFESVWAGLLLVVPFWGLVIALVVLL